MPLTDKQLKSLQADGRRRKYSDAGGVPGLYIEVSPTGRKWWRLKFRMDGKERLLALGVYPDVSLKDARQMALAARQMIAAGIDPVQARRHSGAWRGTGSSATAGSGRRSMEKRSGCVLRAAFFQCWGSSL